MNEPWLISLQTDTPQSGFDLAVKLSRMSIKTIQPTDAVRKELRAAYDSDTEQLIASAHVIALNFQTISAANNYWR